MRVLSKCALVVLAISTLGVGGAGACGGLFCQNTPVDQQAERIIFSINNNNTISAYVQINYTGSGHDARKRLGNHLRDLRAATR